MLFTLLLSVAEIKSALKSKDDEYIKLLKRQADDIDALLGFMSKQLMEMGTAYKEELEAIERALLLVSCAIMVMAWQAICLPMLVLRCIEAGTVWLATVH